MEHMRTLSLLDSSLPRITRAEDRGLLTSTGRSLLVDYIGTMRGAIEAHQQERERIAGDTSLSEPGKTAAAGRAFERAEQVVNEQAQKVAAQTEDAIAKARRKATPAPPNMPADVLEAQQANSRTDARMVLDATSDAELHIALAHLAENGQPAMRHLILGSDFADLYLRSRGSRTAVAAWANQRHALLPLVLDEQGTAAAQTLTAAPDLHAVVKIAQHAAASWAREMKPRGWTPAA